MTQLADPDAFYHALVELHRDLSAEQSQALNARLILLMAERIGDDAQLHSLLREAAASGATARARTEP
jgi:hypothetical protein